MTSADMAEVMTSADMETGSYMEQCMKGICSSALPPFLFILFLSLFLVGVYWEQCMKNVALFHQVVANDMCTLLACWLSLSLFTITS
jgi:hypothetical protein